MIGQKMLDAFNEQINRELYSEYLYLAMAAWFRAANYDGFAAFFEKQADEERAHAMKFYKFVNERGGRVVLASIAAPEKDFAGVTKIFSLSLEHERFVTKSIHGLVELAAAERDHASASFLKWYVDEQVEEEATMEGILAKLEMIKDNAQGLLFLDAQLGKR